MPHVVSGKDADEVVIAGQVCNYSAENKEPYNEKKSNRT
jgi:hypothetical protein